MSDCLKKNIDYLDNRTHLIIHGYFRTQFKSIIIPLDIIHVTTIFVDDHFMFTRGGYQWYIDGDLLQQMKTAESNQVFTHSIFDCWITLAN